MTDRTYNVITPWNGVPIKAWTKGIPLKDAARQQLLNMAQLPSIYKRVADVPDVYLGHWRSRGQRASAREGKPVLTIVVTTSSIGLDETAPQLPEQTTSAVS